VGSYKANAWGLYDMHGNVFEWCADRYGADSYKTAERKDPKGPATGTSWIYRGGNYASIVRYCRSAYRNQSHADARYTGVGLRVACDIGGTR
jgi:formylglycine-generating enzyme required for sulfatase activity